MLLCAYLDERSNSVEGQQRVCKHSRDTDTVGSLWPKIARVDVSLRRRLKKGKKGEEENHLCDASDVEKAGKKTGSILDIIVNIH